MPKFTRSGYAIDTAVLGEAPDLTSFDFLNLRSRVLWRQHEEARRSQVANVHSCRLFRLVIRQKQRGATRPLSHKWRPRCLWRHQNQYAQSQLPLLGAHNSRFGHRESYTHYCRAAALPTKGATPKTRTKPRTSSGAFWRQRDGAMVCLLAARCESKYALS